MLGRYSEEDLLKLRASPLIVKPANLAEIHAIILAQNVQEPTSKRLPGRGVKLDDALSPTEAFQKRPFLDGTQRKSTTDIERVVLGPPRNRFGSSTVRANGRNGDTDNTSQDKDTPIEKYKSGDRFSDRRTNGKSGRDTESDDRYARRRNEDGEERPRRPKWAQDDTEDTRRESRFGKKFEQPWIRGDHTADEIRREGDGEWRRGGGRDRGWGREQPLDAEPEWLEGEEDSAAPGRTQADLQRWLQERKAKELGIELPAEQPAAPAAIVTEESLTKSNLPQLFDEEADDSMDKFFTRLTEQKAAPAVQKAAAAKPHGKSRFGSLFGPTPIDTQKSVSPEPAAQSAPPAPFRQASAGPDPIQQMFGLSIREKMAPSPAAIAAAGPQSAGDANPDQAGFARILEMLQGRNNNPTAQAETNQPQSPAQGSAHPRESKPRVPLYARDSQQKNGSPQDTASPLFALLGGQAPPRQSAPQQPHYDSQSRRSTGQDRLEASKSPTDPAPGRHSSQKDELLLNLLKQASQAPKPTPGLEQYSHRGMSDEHNSRMAMARHEMPAPPDMSMMRGYPQGPPEDSRMRYNEEAMLYDSHPRHSNNDPTRPVYDEPLLDTMRSSGPRGGPAGHGHGLPPGLARPPGFDHVGQSRLPPPGWNGGPPPPQQSQQHMQGRQPGPPPSGMPNPPSRSNIPPGYGPPPSQQQIRDPRPPPQSGPQRKYTGDAGMPMMGPPPGFMGNAPPGLMGMMGGPGQQQHQQGPPPPQQQHHHPSQRGYPMQSPTDQAPPGRQFMDMFSENMPGGGMGPSGPGRNGVRGGVGNAPMGPYR